MMWNISFYQTTHGRYPAKDFIDSLDAKTQDKIYQMIYVYLTRFGLSLRPPHSKQIASNLYELRITGKVPVRIFYSFINLKIVILHGIVKKTNSIPDKELRTTKRRKQSMLDFK